MQTAFINGKLLLPTRTLENAVLIVSSGKIAGVCTGALPDGFDGTIVDAAGRYVSPGFVDIHTHGAGGSDYMDGTPEAITNAASMHLFHGATSILPTTLTGTNAELFELFDVFRDVQSSMRHGPTLLGLHLEGPYFSLAQRGAQDPRYIRIPEEKEYLDILRRGDGLIKRWSVAPELPGALRMGRTLRERGVVCSAGHTDATCEELFAASENGYSLLTHFYSGMSTISRKGGFRIAGAVEAGYLNDDLAVEIIADGCHLPESLLRLVVKCKPRDKICLVTDSMRASGMPDGEYLLGSLRNGTPTIVEDGVAKMPDRTAFAGSVCTPDRLVSTMRRLTDLSMAEAVRMVTENPCRIMGIADRKGSLSVGKDADVLLFDEDIRISYVMSRGEVLIRNQI